MDEIRDKRKHNFFQIYNKVLDDFDISVGAFWLYSTLCRYAGKKDNCFPSVETLSKRARVGRDHGVSQQCVRNWLDEITSCHLVTVIERPGRSNRYEIEDIEEIITPQPQLSGEEINPSTTVEAGPTLELMAPLNPSLDEEYSGKKIENKNTNSATNFSPQPGGGSPEPFRTNFGFHDFISGYPKHRVNDKSKREARRTWNILTHENQQKAVVSLAVWRESSEWLKEDGLYVPNPANFLGSPRYHETDPHRLYRDECEKVRQHFTEVTGQANGFNKMSAERLGMLSRRFDEAVAMAPAGVNAQENAVALMLDAIDACWASLYYQKNRDRISLESVFATPEIFEKWAKREAGP